MLLIYPPVAKPSEPPAGLAKLAGVLNHHHIQPHILDANLEALYHRIDRPVDSSDQWTRRATAHLASNLATLLNGEAFNNPDRYKRTVMDINRVVQTAQPQFDGAVTLVNYTDHRFSPVQSADLILAAENPGTKSLFRIFQFPPRWPAPRPATVPHWLFP